MEKRLILIMSLYSVTVDSLFSTYLAVPEIYLYFILFIYIFRLYFTINLILYTQRNSSYSRGA